jgi:hypothetical protein
MGGRLGLAGFKQQIKLRKARLRGLWNVAEQFYLAATAQNLKRLVRHFAHKQSPEPSTTIERYEKR